MKKITPYEDAIIVDDEKDLCFLLKMLLEKEDIRTQSVHSLSGMNKILRKKPSVIFLDNQLPDGMGINHIPHIKRVLPLVKIVLMTAHESVSARVSAFKNGADAFLAKPFSRHALRDALSSLSFPKAQ